MAVAAVHSGGIADHIHPEPQGFIRKYVFSIDHKIIGIQYMVTAGLFMILGGMLAELIRVQLMKANGGFMTPDTYNEVYSVHGSTMVWLVIIPMLTGGFGNFVFPVQIGARSLRPLRIDPYGCARWPELLQFGLSLFPDCKLITAQIPY